MQSTLRVLATLVAALAVAAAWVIRQLVAIARATYRAGHATGIAWHRWGWPALLATTRAIAWVWSQIDWPTALAITKDTLAVIVAGTVAAAQAALPTLVAMSGALGRRYALWLGVAAPMAAVAGIAAVVPTRVAAAQEAAPMAAVAAARAGKAIAVAAKADITATRPTRAPHRRQ